MRYCPVCFTHKKLYHGINHIRWWWKYKVLKHPMPDITETLNEMIPVVFTMIASAECAHEIDEEIKRAREQCH